MFALELRSIERNCCYNLVGDRHHQLMLSIRKWTWNTWEWLLHFLPGRNQLSSDWRGDLSIFGTCSINRIPIRICIGTIGWKFQVPYISGKCCVHHCKRSIKLLNMSHILLKGVGGDVEWWRNMPMSVWLEFIYGTFNWRMMKCAEHNFINTMHSIWPSSVQNFDKVRGGRQKDEGFLFALRLALLTLVQIGTCLS